MKNKLLNQALESLNRIQEYCKAYNRDIQTRIDMIYLNRQIDDVRLVLGRFDEIYDLIDFAREKGEKL